MAQAYIFSGSTPIPIGGSPPHPDPSTDNALARYTGTKGELQNGQILEDDSGNLTEVGNMTTDASNWSLTGKPGIGVGGFSLSITAATSDTDEGGPLNLTGGQTSVGNADGGAVDIKGGRGGNGGSINIECGPADSGNGGPITIIATPGVGTNKNGGSITIHPGANTGSGTDGSLILQESDQTARITIKGSTITIGGTMAMGSNALTTSSTLDGRDVSVDGTKLDLVTLVPSAPLMEPAGLYAGNLTDVTAFADDTGYWTYMGLAVDAFTQADVLFNITTAFVLGTGGDGYSQVAIASGDFSLNSAPTLTIEGNVNGGLGSTGIIKRTVTSLTISAGDGVWVGIANKIKESGGTNLQIRGVLADDIQSGVFQTTAGEPSAGPGTATIAGATIVPPWCRLILS